MEDSLFLPYSEKFRDFSLEREFRNATFPDDKKQSRTLLLFLAFFLAAIVINNIVSSGIYSGSVILPNVILTIEALGVAFLLVVVYLMEKTEDYAIFDITFFALMIFFSALTLYDNIIRPPDFMGSFSLCIYIIYYVFVPIPTRYQLPPSLLLTAGLIIIMLVFREPNYPSQVTIFILSSIFLNVSCHVLAVKLGRSRRFSFVATLREKRSAKALKKTQEEIKVLSGILPICASCLKIKDDRGIWQRTDTYIMEHSEAKFSHSICPDCSNSYTRQNF